ncbi:hypothetical protein [Undibacter mobilis]|uniref:Yip1 domain-containing protein n=1 Tax=Undibacter mobilis TaxID=2292256 RepID=A0A371BAL9_9BRAD|nr:hypothetical protein [Undibacter mobilis]RDV04646.1 hypothetical protein DXH78_08775 [Undibacter mobilis]
MEKLVDLLFKDDLVKSYHSLIGAAREPEAKDNLIPLSLSMLIVLAVLLAVSKTLFGDAEFSLVQHFTGTAALLLSVYLIAGFLFAPFIALETINRYAVTFFVCLLTASVLFITLSVLFGFFTTGMLDALGYRLPASTRASWMVLTIEEWIPALIYSFLACAAVFAPRVWRNRRSLSHLTRYFLCFIATTLLFHFFVFDRGGFFDNAMSLMSKIKV